jgi:DNA-binding XRE family transcriptional regulator
MDIRSTRKSLKLSLQDAGNLIGVTREAVRLAEAGKAPKAAIALATAYKKYSAKKVKNMPEFDISFKFVRRSDGATTLKSSSKTPFEITPAVIDALIEGFKLGSASESTIVFE